MSKELIKSNVKVPKIGKLEDYINLPIVKDGRAIGVVTSAVEESYQYLLKITLWQDVGVDILKGVPSAVTFD